MIGLIIIDDEPAIRNMLSEIFDFKSMGIKLLSSYNSAVNALEEITTDTDIVIVDMKMPVMSGTEFISIAKKRYPWLHFIVLSGYDDFELVKNTFVLGVEDYFLKSELDPEKFENTLRNIASKITKKRDSINITTEPKYTYRTKLMKNILWNNDLLSSPNDEIMHLQSYYMRVMVIKIPEYDSVLAQFFNGDAEALHYGISNIMQELIGDKPNVNFFHNIKNEFVVIISDKHPNSFKTNIHLIFKQLVDGFNQYMNCVTNGGLSEEATGIKNLPLLYSHARSACDYSYIEGNGIMIEYEKRCNCTQKIDVVSLIEDVRQSLNTMHISQFVSELEYIIPETGDVALNQTENVKHLINQIYYEVKSFILKNNIPAKETFEKDGEKIIACGCAHDFKIWLKNELLGIDSNLQKGNSLVNKTINIIHECFSDSNLRLNSIANDLGVTYNHLSRLFKTQTGSGFNQYLNDIRMKTAMELLQTSNLKLYEIADRVGYQNYENFSRSFKAYYGTSPKKIYGSKNN